MSFVQILTLLLALSVAFNIAFGAALLARRAGASTANAILTGAGAAATSLALYFAAVAAYQEGNASECDQLVHGAVPTVHVVNGPDFGSNGVWRIDQWTFESRSVS